MQRDIFLFWRLAMPLKRKTESFHAGCWPFVPSQGMDFRAIPPEDAPLGESLALSGGGSHKEIILKGTFKIQRIHQLTKLSGHMIRELFV
ncbi:hypothetical protein [Azospirillum sp. SYSU D00513]|uniref:hypothetical protein n=1 Tax=Azospirillum sp. SYSU D00513 TaxID=2812561 RepID=UPI001A96CFAC|nr:hypothetical protein [Azospirillum sp. SYSU D00513]